MKFRLLPLFTIAFLVLGSTNTTAQSFTDIAIGSAHICAITDAAEVDCTTSPVAERYDAPAGLPQMIDIAAGDQHTCGIDIEGKAVCWGATEIDFNGSTDSTQLFGSFNQLDIPGITQPLISIGAGDHHTCAVDADGRVHCWGLNTNLQTEPPGDGYGENGAGFTKVAGGSNFSCGIQTDGDIACWTDDTSRDNGRSRNVEGPFTDLDVTKFNACGLKEDGSIDCWQNRFEPPNNGPYTDLVVSRLAICGLNLNQTVDCTFDSNFSSEGPVFSEDTRFTAIDSGTEVFGPAVPFCGLTDSGTIECASLFGTVPPPGSIDETVQDLSTVNYALTATRYASNSIELFWNQVPQRFGREQIFVEIYRNDILVDTTLNSNSWYDSDTQVQNPVVYKIRATDIQGNVGPFSADVSVNNITGNVNFADGTTNFDIMEPLHTVDSVRVVFSGNTRFIAWTGPTPGVDGLKGYEVRINNEVVAFNDGFIHRLESFDTTRCHIISVAAVSDTGTIFDYQTMVFNRFSRTPFVSSCVAR